MRHLFNSTFYPGSLPDLVFPLEGENWYPGTILISFYLVMGKAHQEKQKSFACNHLKCHGHSPRLCETNAVTVDTCVCQKQHGFRQTRPHLLAAACQVIVTGHVPSFLSACFLICHIGWWVAVRFK